MTRSHDGSLILTNIQPQENSQQVSAETSIEAISLHKNKANQPTITHSKIPKPYSILDPSACTITGVPWNRCVLTEENTGVEQSRVPYTASVLS